ncbi:ISAs1 family transposase [Kitasatospora sp. NPDC127116]|uniref:ISAs1 family transposase n=1 Tax=Kitasatospora sp. NPDC127116 TaxID=3345367 RepID=UPI00362EC451
MSARSSSPIPAGLDQLAATRPAEPGEHPQLLGRLAAVPDPRRAKGRRHPLAFVLALAACAVLAGAKSLAAIAEWAADAPPAVLVALGAARREPSGPTAPAEATVRRVLRRVDGDALDAAIGTWLAARDPGRPPPGQDRAAPRRRSLAVDGKTVRGARRTDGTQVHLLAAMTGAGLVTARREVDSKTNEITVFRPMLAPLDLADTVVTFDALHSQTAHARFLVEDKKAHRIAVIKGNQPLLHQHLKQLPWRDVPLLDKTRAIAHGRDGIRRVKTATVTCGLDFPHAAQAVQIVRRRRIVTTGKVTLERVHAVTDLTAEQADAPEIAHHVREHRGIENKIHHIRDTTFAEDAPPAFGREVPPRACAPEPHPGPWPHCATSPSAPSASPATTTSPPACANTAETPPGHSTPSASRDQTGQTL